MGKSKAPPPPATPNYAAAAEQTAAGNLAMARTQIKANRINQVNPYGTLSYKQVGGNNVNDPDGQWEQTETLNPQAQAALDQQLELNKKYGEVANVGFDKVRNIFENPGLDVSGLPKRAIGVGQTAQDAIMSRLGPQMAQREEALRTRMANQGITLGSEAYGREMTQQDQQSNDLRMQAALQGINLDQNNRSSALEEQAYLQDRPLNLINSLRSGNQVNAPKFQQFAQQVYTPGADMMGAAQSQFAGDMSGYNANVANINAKNAQTTGMVKGIFGVGMGLAGLPGAGGSMIAGAKGLFA